MSLAAAAEVVFHTLRHEAAGRIRRTLDRAARRERPLRVGVDIRPFYEPLTGVGWYLYHLIHELAKHDDVELLLFGDARVTDYGPRLHADVPERAALCWFDLRGKPFSMATRSATAGAYVAWMAMAGCDVFFGANYFLPRLHSAIAKRRVVTIHDLTWKRFPELLQKETLENLERQMTRELAMADEVICVSESTRRDLLYFYQIDPRRVTAIHSGLGAAAGPEPVPGLPSRYLLFVSTIEPRKNLETLIDAWEKLRRDGAYEGSLVVVGKIGWKSERMVKRLATPGIVHLDYLEPSQLASVYRGAEIFAFPSIYEGFGFPLLEAMAQGIPTVAAHSSSLPEIGGDAALYFDPKDSDALAQRIREILGSATLREQLVTKGRERAASFRWDDAAAKTLEVLRRAAHS